MALRPHLWAYDDAPVKNPTAVLVLLALADEAADDGTGACPYVDKLAARARVSVRSVQNYLRDLYQQRIIDIGDQVVSMQRYRRSAGQAPRCWNLNLSATWKAVPDPRTEEEMKAYSPAIGKKPVRRKVGSSDSHDAGGVQDLHPSRNANKPDSDDLSSAGVQILHPCERCSQLHPRGAASCTPEVQPVAPFLSSPLKPDSVPPSEVRLGDAENEENSAIEATGQMTISGEIEAAGPSQLVRENQLVMGIARDWLTARAEHGCPPMFKGDPLMALRGVIEKAREAQCTENEIKFALAWTDEDVPPVTLLAKGVTQARRGWRPPVGWKPGDGRGGGFARMPAQARPSTTDARVNTALDLAEKYRQQEEASALQEASR